MQLRYLTTLEPAREQMAKVSSIAFAPNNLRLAVVTVDRIVRLYDETGEQRDKFSTKPADKANAKNYAVTAMEWSPDSTKLAIAQSDNIVFVYKLGTEWKDKKSICNKFLQTSSVTSLVWPASRPNEVVYGLANGQVKVGMIKTNKPSTLYSGDAYVVAMAANSETDERAGVCSGHLDGSVYRYFFNQGGGPIKIVFHPCVPYALSWGHSIVAAGNDQTVTFYDDNGGVERSFQYADEATGPKCKEFCCARFNPAGEAVVVGNYNSFYVYTYNHRTDTWDQAETKEVPNLYTVTALAWKADGSRLALGSLCGVLDIYDACIRRSHYKGKFEFTYVSLSQVIVKRLAGSDRAGDRIQLKSIYGCEITKINIHRDRFVVANTVDHAYGKETLLLGDLETFKLSEIMWHGGGNEKFIFDTDSVCIVHHAGELSLIEYGSNEILGTVRTEHVSSHLLSVRINERPARSGADNPDTPRVDDEAGKSKKVAFLQDAKTISTKDLCNGHTTIVAHDSTIDWLELNERGSMLLFRDKRRHVHLYDVIRQVRTNLLDYCTYVQWVPQSDVVVAQNRGNLCVWYNIRVPEPTVHQIKGDIDEIERIEPSYDADGNFVKGRTEVIVDEGISAASYILDEDLICFGTAVDDRDYGKAMDLLEQLEMSPEAQGMWEQLEQMATEGGDLRIAQRCAAALGNVARAAYLGRVNDIVDKVKAEGLPGGMSAKEHWDVRARMCLLNKDVEGAEEVLLMQGKTDEAIEMYQMLHRHDQAIAVAESRSHPDAQQMKAQFFQRLLSTGQEEVAARLREGDQKYSEAIDLYLKAGMPAKAAGVIRDHNIMNDPRRLDEVTSALVDANLHAKAGEMYERSDNIRGALDAYKKGNAFAKAVELAQRHFQAQVVDLQEMWGDHLRAENRMDQAVNHFIEAGVHTKAVDAAVMARQWSKAKEIVDMIAISDKETSRPFYLKIARHYEQTANYDEAEACYVGAGAVERAVEMYTDANKWDTAYKLAKKQDLSDREINALYIEQAQKMESQKRLKEAEKLYVMVSQHDMVISMYKKHRKYDALIRLVKTYRKEMLKDTHQYIAQQLESESSGNLRDAEHHYCQAGEWLSAVNMYRSNDLWEDALRVSKVQGGAQAYKRVAYAWALSKGGNEGAQLLKDRGLIEPAIEYAIESGAFDHAFKLAEEGAKNKLPEIYLKHALYLEDEERYAQAEENFIKANKPREAIDMYMHQQQWREALRCAQDADPSAVPDVYVGQGHAAKERKEYAVGEKLYMMANKPEAALAMYEEANMWQDALRITQKHLPHKMAEVNMAHQAYQAGEGIGGTKADFLSQGKVWEQSKHWSQAINAYLNATTKALDDVDDLEEIWEKAVAVARQYLRGRYKEVVDEVVGRLIDVRRHDTAAEILREAERVSEGVAVAVDGQRWAKARELAQGNRQLEDQVESKHQSTLMGDNNTDELMEMGNTEAALDVLATQLKDWDRLWQMCDRERVGERVKAKYAAVRVGQLLEDAEDAASIDLAVTTLHDYGAPAGDEHVDMYLRVGTALLGRSAPAEKGSGYAESVKALREVCYRLAGPMRKSARDVAAFEELFMAVHYMHVFLVCKAAGGQLLDVACKVAVTLLRYPNVVPCDKLFYLAGQAFKAQGHDNMAFVMLNKYVDIADATDEDEDEPELDHTDFDDTVIPAPVPPRSHYVPDEDTREEAKDWVLAACMSVDSIEAKLPGKDAAEYGSLEYGLYSNPSLESCIVTGFPVQKYELVEVAGAQACKVDYNAYVRSFKTCPWTGKTASPKH